MATRRTFLTGSAGAVAGALATPPSRAYETSAQPCATEIASLCGEWLFRIDPDNLGTKKNWYGTDIPGGNWRTVGVPHTWQVEAELADFRGLAWYRRSFDTRESWQGCAVRVEFEAVFHTATVWVNGRLVGEHARKGYTAFTLDIAQALDRDQPNIIAVRVDNAFNQHMVPRGRSSDWANDGGIFRPVQLLVTPRIFVERVDVDAVPDLESGDGKLTITAYVRNTGATSWSGKTSFTIAEGENSLIVLTGSQTNSTSKAFSIKPGGLEKLTLETILPKARLWHFDHPHLYHLDFFISAEANVHAFTTLFGVRKREILDGAFHLNGERVRLMGMERMAGSNPEFGMAEPQEWITHDDADMKDLNCVFTRVHWPQDKRVLDYCDRHGILNANRGSRLGSRDLRGHGCPA